MVKMNGFAAIDSVRPFRFWADKAAVAANFHLGNGTCHLGIRTNSKHSRCMYTLQFFGEQAQPVLPHTPLASVACKVQNKLSKQCTCGHTRAFCKFQRCCSLQKLVGKHPKPLNDFFKIGYAPAELNITLSWKVR